MMYRVGVIIPSSNTTMEYEFNRALQGVATVHAARVWLERVEVDELRKIESEPVREARKLATAAVDVIAFGCTSGSFVGGWEQYVQIEKEIKTSTGLECVATSGAVLRALKHLGFRKICLVTPYTSDITSLEAAFLRGHGFEVVCSYHASFVDNREIGRIRDEEVVEWVGKTSYREADTIFISCTNLRTFNAIKHIEEMAGKPVVSSNSSTLWNVLNVLGCVVEKPELGRLFSR
ncbi:MAG: aspartate/glutamate racemase family protein [Candidatus Caldarchaeum sp.]